MTFRHVLAKDHRGVSVTALMVFVVFAFTVVLANGIVLNANTQARAAVEKIITRGEDEVRSFCGQSYNSGEPNCTLDRVVRCGKQYVLTSECPGLDEVLFNSRGEVVGTCSTSGGEFTRRQCEEKITPLILSQCIQNENLCP